MTYDTEKFIGEFRASMLANGYEFGDEAEAELRESLIEFESTVSYIDGQEKAKN